MKKKNVEMAYMMPLDFLKKFYKDEKTVRTKLVNYVKQHKTSLQISSKHVKNKTYCITYGQYQSNEPGYGQFIDRLFKLKSPRLESANLCKLVLEEDYKDYIYFYDKDIKHIIEMDDNASDRIYTFLLNGFIPGELLFSLDNNQRNKIKKFLDDLDVKDKNTTKTLVEKKLYDLTGWNIILDGIKNYSTFLFEMCDIHNNEVGFRKINSEIYCQAVTYPVFDSLVFESDSTTLQNFFKPHSTIYIGKQANGTYKIRFTIKTTVQSYVDELKKNIKNAIAESSSILTSTLPDILQILGAYAFRASKNAPMYTVQLSERDEICRNREIINCAVEAGLVEENKRTHTLSFIHKHNRIILDAMFRAEVDNRLTQKLTNTNRLRKLSGLSPEDINNTYRVLGYYANLASQRDSHMIFETEIAEEDKSIINFAIESDIIQYFDDEPHNSQLRFVNKHYRTILVELNQILCSLQNDENWENYGFESYREDNTSGEKNHLKKSFNWASLYYSIYASQLHDSERRKFFKTIFKYALDYSTLNNHRDLQIKALQVISYYLQAGNPLYYEDEKDLFQVAYSENLYQMQSILVNSFLAKREIYKTTIYEHFWDSCCIYNGYVKKQPYYFFLQCLIQEEHEALFSDNNAAAFFYEAIKIQDKTWKEINNNNQTQLELQKIIKMTISAGEQLKLYLSQPKILREDHILMWYVYGVQALGHACANVLMDKTILRDSLLNILNNPSNEDTRKTFCETLIYADYFTRKYNQLYCSGDHDVHKESINKMYLLCGTTRFFAQYRVAFTTISLENSSKTYMLKEDYKKWLEMENEKNVRYSFLLLLFLAHTDFDWQHIITSYVSDQYQPDLFLEYDNMPSTWDKYKEELKTWQV